MNKKLAVLIAAIVTVSGAAVVGVAYASGDSGCVAGGPMTAAVAPPDGGSADDAEAPAEGPDCVPAVPAVPTVPAR
ncbi:MAG TPA: hypothetical protein VF482_17220 [Trebonia sp.]